VYYFVIIHSAWGVTYRCVCAREWILYFYGEMYKLIFLVQFWIISYFNCVGYFNVDEQWNYYSAFCTLHIIKYFSVWNDKSDDVLWAEVWSVTIAQNT
jgi:hypothetical protein